MKKRIHPDDIADFEEAASEPDNYDSRMRPPYDPYSEPRTRTRQPTYTEQRAATRRLAIALENRNRVQLKYLRKHIAWARKWAFKAGIDPRDTNLWEL